MRKAAESIQGNRNFMKDFARVEDKVSWSPFEKVRQYKEYFSPDFSSELERYEDKHGI